MWKPYSLPNSLKSLLNWPKYAQKISVDPHILSTAGWIYHSYGTAYQNGWKNRPSHKHYDMPHSYQSVVVPIQKVAFSHA